MRRILVTSAGGSPAANFIRSLRKAPEPIYIIGIDANPYSLERAETDEKHLGPKASEPDYIPIIKEIIQETHSDLLHVQHSKEVPIISKHRNGLNVKTYLPDHSSVEICDNKMESFRHWKKAGLKVPETLLLRSGEDVDRAFQCFGGRVWLRAIRGSGGAGAAPVTNPEWAKFWVTIHDGWNKFTASQCLTPASVIWPSLWKDGELIVAQGRRRLYWEFGGKFLSGVSGITGGGIIVSDPVVDKIAQEAILAIDKKPNGIMGVDLTYDEEGIPNPTEINAGRFFTTHQFFTEAGLNMPYMYVKIALGEQLPDIPRKINPLPLGLVWIRGVDFLPKLTTAEQIKASEEQLKRRRFNLGQT